MADQTTANESQDLSTDTEFLDSASSTPKATVSKRKASPLFDIAKRTTRSQSVPRKSQQNLSFSDMMMRTFAEPTFVEGIVPILQGVLTPVFENIAKEALSTVSASLKTTLDNITDSTKSLQETVAKQVDIIAKQRVEIDQFKADLQARDDKIESLESQVKSLSHDIHSLKLANSDLEQYGRRNSLRISNLKVDTSKSEASMTEEVVGFINSKLLPENNPLKVSDIERCHPIGRSSPNKPRQILVKFSRYHMKHAVYSVKKKLKKNPDKIFITEDLTRMNYAIVKSLQQLRTAGKIHGFWTNNGNVMAKRFEDSTPVRLHCVGDIDYSLNLNSNEEALESCSSTDL